MIRKPALALAAAGLLATAGPLIAQQAGPNGGLVGGAGAHKTELVVSPNQLTVYLLEDGKVHDSKGATLRAVVQQGGKTKTIALIDEQGKRLVGKLDAPLEKGAVVAVTGKDSHGDRFSARYVIK
jgi:hypothetical protein